MEIGAMLTHTSQLISSSIIILSLIPKVREWFLKPICSRLKSLELATIRNELFILINCYPDNVESIYEMYESYVSLGGNGYVKTIFKIWEDTHIKKGKSK